MRFQQFSWLLFFTAGFAFAQSTPVQTGSSSEPSHFVLEVSGKKVGQATYQIEPAGQGFHLQSNYSFNTTGGWVDLPEKKSSGENAAVETEPAAPSDTASSAAPAKESPPEAGTDAVSDKDKKFKPDTSTVRCDRRADLDAAYGMVKDFLVVNVSRADEDASITVDPDRQHFIYKLKSSVQSIDQRNELHPGTVVLNNFDPSGVQVLVWLATSHPIASGDYWAVLAQGKGVYLPIKLSTAEAAEGELNNEQLPLKHWRLQIQDTDTDIWTDSHNRLMAFVMPSEQVTYRREGFERGPTPGESTPGADAVEERHVSFTSEGLKFPAIVTIPRVLHGPVPIVVMVAGSGPQDADETIGPNKPFRDIAYGLAAAGIASLRYDKRTHFAPQTFQPHPDLDHEITIDAVAALQYAATVPEANPNKIFLLGHSLGGTMAPVIAAQAPRLGRGSVRGIIFLAAGAESIDKIIERQTAFQAARHGATAAQLEQTQKQWQDVFVTVKDTNTPADRVAGVAPLQLPVAYWRSWLHQDPAKELAKLRLPALNLRGNKDIQVSEKDFNKLQDANYAPGSLGEQIDGLNHLFMPLTGDSTGDEYSKPNHVSPDAIGAIANWIDTIQ